MLISSSLRPSLSQEVPRYPSMFMINSKLITFSYSHVSHKKVLYGTSTNYGGFGRLFGLENSKTNSTHLNKPGPKWTIFTGNRWLDFEFRD